MGVGGGGGWGKSHSKDCFRSQKHDETPSYECLHEEATKTNKLRIFICLHCTHNEKKFLPKPFLFISLYKSPLSTFKIDPSGHPSLFSFLFFSIKKVPRKEIKRKPQKDNLTAYHFNQNQLSQIRKYVIN